MGLAVGPLTYDPLRSILWVPKHDKQTHIHTGRFHPISLNCGNVYLSVGTKTTAEWYCLRMKHLSKRSNVQPFRWVEFNINNSLQSFLFDYWLYNKILFLSEPFCYTTLIFYLFFSPKKSRALRRILNGEFKTLLHVPRPWQSDNRCIDHAE